MLSHDCRVIPTSGPVQRKFQSMFRIGGVNGKIARNEACGTPASVDDVAVRFSDDPAKPLVMMYLSQFVNDGYAEWHARDDGDFELRFVTGEIFLMADTTMTRLA
jgi:hypothetical protein